MLRVVQVLSDNGFQDRYRSPIAESHRCEVTTSTPRCARAISQEPSGARHDFDTRATQNHARRRQPLRFRIMALTCDDAC